ncbi:MAG: hypothetical protein WCA45_03200 [Thiobacillaceae bacterium]
MLNEKWGCAPELSVNTLHRASPNAQLLGASRYSVTRRLILNVGFALEVDAAAPDFQLATGATMLLGEIGLR